MKCSICGEEIPDNSKFCVKCGSPVELKQPEKSVEESFIKICPKCGQTFEDNIKFCTKDGTPLDIKSISKFSAQDKTTIPTSAYESVRPKKSSKNLLVILIVGVLLIIAGVGGYLLYPKIFAKKQETTAKEEKVRLPASSSETKEEQRGNEKAGEEKIQTAKIEVPKEREKQDRKQELVPPPPKIDPLKLEDDINRALRNANIQNVTALVNKDLEVTLKGTVGSSKDKERAFEVVRKFKVQRIKDSVFIVE